MSSTLSFPTRRHGCTLYGEMLVTVEEPFVVRRFSNGIVVTDALHPPRLIKEYLSPLPPIKPRIERLHLAGGWLCRGSWGRTPHDAYDAWLEAF